MRDRATLPVRAGAVIEDDDHHFRFAIEQVNTGPSEHMAVRAREWRATSCTEAGAVLRTLDIPRASFVSKR